MAQYLVIAMDGKDAEAPARRMAAREAHLANVRQMKEDGTIIAGGAILDDAGAMIGSAVFVDFAERQDLDHWLRTDPYATHDVWRQIEVKPMRMVGK